MKVKTILKKTPRLSPRDEFIKAVAVMLTRDLGRKSILLQMQNQDALDWCKAFQAAGCNGYPTSEEAESCIRKTLERTEAL